MKLKGRTIKKIVSIAVTIILMVFLVFLNLLAGFEYRIQDRVYQNPRLPYPIAIFGIDETAMEYFGPWPWPRSVMAQAIDILNTYEDWRPAVIGVDVLYSEASYFFPDGDVALVEAASRAGNVVLASTFHIGGICHETLVFDPLIERLILPFPDLLPHVEHGIVNAITDHDGVIRNAFLWERFAGEVIYSFPVAVSMMYQGVTEPHPFIQENADMFIRYSGKPGHSGFIYGNFFEVSFAEIFDPLFDPGWYDGRIVLIGPMLLA